MQNEDRVSTSAVGVGVAKGILLAIGNFAATACIGWVALSVALGGSMANPNGASDVLGLGIGAAVPAGVVCLFAYIAYAATHLGGPRFLRP
jgi:purine-cytosine permease-like protein